MRRIFFSLLSAFLVTIWAVTIPVNASAVYQSATQAADPYAIIAEVNAIRIANGLPALEIDPILMSTAQQTSATMAAYSSCAHLGGVSDRIAAAGYGSGAKVWATENISCGISKTVQTIVYQDWADELHMLPMTNPNYRHIGVGVTTINGYSYYVLHAAYTSGNPGSAGSSSTAATPKPTISQRIIPVETSTPNPDGSIVHVVQEGQALWSIAIAYNVKIVDIAALNPLIDPNNPVLYFGQKIMIRGPSTPTISPTATNTSPPPTRTPVPTFTPRPTIPTRTPTVTSTATRPPILPEIPSLKSGEARWLGIAIIVICALGLISVLTTFLGERKQPPLS